MKIAVFDFCDTIVSFQTADRFVYYALSHTDNTKLKRRKKILDNMQKNNIIRKIDSITHGKYSLNKRFILWQLRGASEQEMDDWSEAYYKEEIIPNLYVDILDYIREYQKKGYLVYLASGGYEIYLRFFVSDYNLDGIFCTKLKFLHNVFSGKIDGRDCMRGEKTALLNTYFNTCFNAEIEYTVAYSDSKSDLPLLLWANRGVLVSKKNYRAWAKEYGLDEYLLSGKTVGSKNIY